MVERETQKGIIIGHKGAALNVLAWKPERFREILRQTNSSGIVRKSE